MQRGAVCVQCAPECRRTDTPRSMVLAAVLWALLVPACAGYNMLVLLPYPGRSHHMVFAPLLDELARRQHNLTVISFFPAQPPHPNRRDVSLVGLAPLSVEVVDLKSIDVKRFFGFEKAFADISLITDLAKSNLRLCEKLLYSEPFQEFVEGRGEYDVILVEHFNSDCMMGLIYNYGLPSVGLMSSPFLPWTPSRLGAPDNPSYVPGMTLAVTDDMTFVERIENAFTLYFYKWWFEVFIRWEEQALLERRLGRKLPPLGEVAADTSVLLVNTHHSLSGARVMPPAFVEVGGIHLYNKTVQPLPEDLEKWVSEAEYGFILFSFGSLIRGSSLPSKRVDAILKVFASLPQRVVWKWEADTIENLPSNVRIMKWLPQYDLLKHPGCVALVTHAGLLSLSEAAAAGVPAVAVAVLGDQFGNAAHAHAAARAPALTLAQLDEEHLRDAIKQALSPENRAAAKRLSAKFVSRPVSPLALAVFYTEQSARLGAAASGLHMSSHARRLTLLQVSMLDVLSTVLGLLLGAAMLCRCCCARCYKLRRGDKPKLT